MGRHGSFGGEDRRHHTSTWKLCPNGIEEVLRSTWETLPEWHRRSVSSIWKSGRSGIEALLADMEDPTMRRRSPDAPISKPRRSDIETLFGRYGSLGREDRRYDGPTMKPLLSISNTRSDDIATSGLLSVKYRRDDPDHVNLLDL